MPSTVGLQMFCRVSKSSSDLPRLTQAPMYTECYFNIPPPAPNSPTPELVSCVQKLIAMSDAIIAKAGVDIMLDQTIRALDEKVHKCSQSDCTVTVVADSSKRPSKQSLTWK